MASSLLLLSFLIHIQTLACMLYTSQSLTIRIFRMHILAIYHKVIVLTLSHTHKPLTKEYKSRYKEYTNVDLSQGTRRTKHLTQINYFKVHKGY